MRERYSFRRKGLWEIFIIFIWLGSIAESAHLKLNNNEIGAVDSREYLLGSRIEPSPDAQRVTIVQRVINGSTVNSTIDWHSALYRQPHMEPGEIREEVKKYTVSGLRGFLYWPVPFDNAHLDEHSATVETKMGTFYIDGAPAFLARGRAWKVEAGLLWKKGFHIVLETFIKTKKLNVKFLSTAEGSKEGNVTYVASVQNMSEEPIYLQWVALSADKEPSMVISLPKNMTEPMNVLKAESRFPIYLVSDVAFINTKSTEVLPRSRVSYLGEEPRFDARRKNILTLKEVLDVNMMMIVPAIVSPR